MAYKIKYNEKECIGCGACTAVCPDNWEIVDNDKAKPKLLDLEELGCNQEAADACPMECIEIVQE